MFKVIISLHIMIEVFTLPSNLLSTCKLLPIAGGEISVVQALLAELPTQFLTYMRSRNIQPSL